LASPLLWAGFFKPNTINMKKILYALLFVCLSTTAFAQDNPAIVSKDSVWSMGGFTSLQTNQVALVNWAAGGETSVAGTALLQLWSKMDNKVGSGSTD
jgi:hypothetical protein